LPWNGSSSSSGRRAGRRTWRLLPNCRPFWRNAAQASTLRETTSALVREPEGPGETRSLSLLQPFELAGAVADFFGRHLHPVQPRQVQVRQRRFPLVAHVPAGAEGAAAAAGQQDRQVVVVVAVAVAVAAAVQEHAAVQQRTLALLDVPQLLQQVSELCD